MVKIPSRSRSCTAGGEPFEPGSTYTSTLNWKAGAWERADFCPKCWNEAFEAAHIWRGEIPPKQEQKQTPDEQAYARFCSLYEREKQPELLFLLTLYLVRKKMLIKRGANLYEEPSSGKTYEVPSTLINARAQEELLELFHA